MKSTFGFLLATVILLAANCKSPLTVQIDELHAASLKTGEALTPKLETLVQRSNSINIQGRALTPEELEFTSQTAAIQDAFAKWKEDVKNVALKPYGEERLEEEKTLNKAILSWVEQVDNMLGTEN